jgi:hypothetical protein
MQYHRFEYMVTYPMIVDDDWVATIVMMTLMTAGLAASTA